MGDSEKAENYVKIAELFLQDDETVEAETYINKASRVIHGISDLSNEDEEAKEESVEDPNWQLKLRYQVSYARILDTKRKFIDAATRYYQLSQERPEQIDVEDL